ncbi:SURF1 family cytochrome oxidase biogenesis protein [Mangrovihabitans endophyticus]|uniref:SURF1-like protein n=1 Tax=Mangrovihabitans endophyticus TaxID=1751298 RepID=A0A8J3C0X1_9ACTN|nr:SURF1 family protein [Mangrovihabitans endophyticus]GGL02633.1 SURF1-like protein [Mangrovihabitans endophyticus]
MYRFLLTPRWLAAAALTVAASVTMVFLGNWQLHRYHERSAINQRIDAAATAAPAPLDTVLPAPAASSGVGRAPGVDTAWTKVAVTGRYDRTHEIQARGRTVDGSVGFEIVTPLVLDDGAAVLIDRGWVPPAAGGAIAAPQVPAAPTGPVTVVGQVHLSESRPAPIEHRDGRIDTRRIAVPRLAAQLPYPVYGAYVLLTEQRPAADPAFVRIPIDHENAWQNGGYAVQWWMFSVMALLVFGWQARKEARGDTGATPPPDRVAQADAARADAARADAARADPARGDRVAHADAAQADRSAAT